jgi:putative transposase
MLEGLIPSVGTVGDALDNGLCETMIGLYKTPAKRGRRDRGRDNTTST